MITTIKLIHLCDDHFVYGGDRILCRMYLASIYFQFIFDSIELYITKIEEIMSTLPREKLIILADVNARFSPIFRSHSSASTIDITLASRGALKFIRKWSVVEG